MQVMAGMQHTRVHTARLYKNDEMLEYRGNDYEKVVK